MLENCFQLLIILLPTKVLLGVHRITLMERCVLQVTSTCDSREIVSHLIEFVVQVVQVCFLLASLHVQMLNFICELGYSWVIVVLRGNLLIHLVELLAHGVSKSANCCF